MGDDPRRSNGNGNIGRQGDHEEDSDGWALVHRDRAHEQAAEGGHSQASHSAVSVHNSSSSCPPVASCGPSSPNDVFVCITSCNMDFQLFCGH